MVSIDKISASNSKFENLRWTPYYYLGAFEALLNPLNEDISRKPGFAYKIKYKMKRFQRAVKPIFKHNFFLSFEN